MKMWGWNQAVLQNNKMHSACRRKDQSKKEKKGDSSLWSAYNAGEHLSNKECQKFTEILRLSLDTES